MVNELVIESPSGKKVNVHAGEFLIETDQPVAEGGEGTAPEPLTLFLASIGSCAGHYVFSFCRSRQIPTEGIRLRQRMHYDQDQHRIARIELIIELNDSFPLKYHKALLRSANLCSVKKHIEQAPEFVTSIALAPGKI